MDKSTVGPSPLLLHERLQNVEHCRHPTPDQHVSKPSHPTLRNRATTFYRQERRLLAKHILGIYEPTHG